MDALQTRVRGHLTVRRAEARRAEGIVEEEIQTFAGWLGTLEVLPTLTALRARGDAVVAQVLAENEGRWESLSERDRTRIEAMSRAIVKRLLHEPTARVKDLNAEHRHARLQLLRELFGLEEERVGGVRVSRSAPAARVTALRLGTRGSALALVQAREVAALLGVEVEIVKITTAGDVDRARGDKSRWTGALEAALLAGEIDLAVHSAKDVPGELAPGTAIAATPRRAEPFDLLIGEASLEHVREGARVGTSALRRRAQLLAARPDLEVCDLRGNVDTRLAKRAAGEVDVLVLAAAGLDRLGRRHEAGGVLTGELFVPAPGQGTVLVQARTGSPAAELALAADHAATHAALTEERAAVRVLEASCETPIGVLAHAGVVRAFAGMPDGSAWLVEEAKSGEGVARALLAAGAGELLAEAAAR